MAALHDLSACPFCDVSVRTAMFFETPNFMAIYNIAPILPGHSLVIPRVHRVSLMELSDHEMNDFFSTARMATRILMKAFQTEAFDMSIQEKPEAGQTIEHLHLHIVPRVKGDLPQPGEWYPLIHQSDQTMIDSFTRPHLNSENLTLITNELKHIAKSMENSTKTKPL
jgi:bis(5'-adenosyl)-triphosphatase